MKKIVLILLSVTLLAANDDPEQKKPKVRFPLGKETTFVTEPLDVDGYIDYAAALNEHWRRGVTPENNANVLLWKALGPRPEGRKMPEEFFKWMGIKSPPEKGDYFIPMSRFAREQLKLGPGPGVSALEEELSRCSQRLWKESEHPNIAAWLKANEKPLAVAMEATKRTHYFSPLVPMRPKSPLLGGLMSGVQKCRDIANALTCRAMVRIGEKRFDDAWQDLLACHRLGRLVGRGATMIDLLVGIAIDAGAGKADLTFLEHVDWKAEQISPCVRELQKLPPMPVPADKVDFGERFVFLDVVVMLDRYGPGILNEISGGEPDKAPSFLEKLFQPSIGEPVLRNGNRWYNRMAKTLRVKDRETREEQLEQIGKELEELNKNAAKSTPGLFQIRKAAGERTGNVLIGLLVPAARKVQNASDRCEQLQNDLYLAFALAAYRRDHGRYPKELEALVPKYLDKIPKDLFSGQPLIYRLTENGYLLYSVGVNGQDEQGQSAGDEPPGDDLVVRMPLPELKQK